MAIERSETKKLNMSTLNEIVGERCRYNVFPWIWLHANDFVWIFVMPLWEKTHLQKIDMTALVEEKSVRYGDNGAQGYLLVSTGSELRWTTIQDDKISNKVKVHVLNHDHVICLLTFIT